MTLITNNKKDVKDDKAIKDNINQNKLMSHVLDD